MLFGPDPLAERLALMWHNHFATSNVKVENLALMRRQNELFRALGRGPFGELLGAVVHDPAMLIWLDAPSNRKGHPNENLARELMELFSLGIGHYTERDVKEAARALTGWSVEEDVFAELPVRHDSGEKTILGKTGPWKGDDLVRMVLEHPATSRRLAWRVGELFLTEEALKTADLDALADGLRARDLDMGWAVETVLRSQLFFADANLGDRVLSPVEYVIGAARALELFEPPCSTLTLADWCGRLGQDLFYPPNVGGWPGGRSWLTTRGLIGRANYAAALVGPHGVGRPTPLDALALAARHDRGRSRDEFIGFLAELLLGSEPDRDWHARIADAVGPAAAWSPDAARHAVVLTLTCPRPSWLEPSGAASRPPDSASRVETDSPRSPAVGKPIPRPVPVHVHASRFPGSVPERLLPDCPGPDRPRLPGPNRPRRGIRGATAGCWWSLELNGGNDGINTVVPFADEGYAKHRKALRLAKDRLIKVNDHVGLHPSLRGFGKLLEAGQLVIAQGVSYPNPSRSHFQSMATWHTARLDPEEHKGPGWLGRALDEAGGAASSLQVGSGPAVGGDPRAPLHRHGHRADRGPHPGRRLRPAEGPRRDATGR